MRWRAACLGFAHAGNDLRLADKQRFADELTRLTWGFKLQHLAGTELWLRIQADPAEAERLRAQAGFAELRYDLVRRDP